MYVSEYRSSAAPRIMFVENCVELPIPRKTEKKEKTVKVDGWKCEMRTLRISGNWISRDKMLLQNFYQLLNLTYIVSRKKFVIRNTMKLHTKQVQVKLKH